MRDPGPMAQAFDDIVESYDSGFHDEIADAPVEFVAPAPNASVADVACGTGPAAPAIAGRRDGAATRILAVDISAGMVTAGSAPAS